MDFGARQAADEQGNLLNLIAAQYVLGTLSGSARLRFQVLLQQQPALRELTYAWERRLNPLANVLEPQPVPAEVWQRIEASLDLLTQSSSLSAVAVGSQVKEAAAAAVEQPNGELPATRKMATGQHDTEQTDLEKTAAGRPTLEKSGSTIANIRTANARKSANDSFWRPMAWVSTVIAASLVAVIAMRPELMMPWPHSADRVQDQLTASRDIAVLTNQQQQPAWIIRQQGKSLILSQFQADQLPANHDLELWRIEGNAAPQSLGVLNISHGRAIVLSGPVPLTANTTLAISLEPKNGSPTGQPTGSVLYSGKVV